MADNLLTFKQLREQDRPLVGQINPMTNVEGAISGLEATRGLLEQLQPAQEVEQPQFDQFIGPSEEALPSAQLREGLPPITQTFGQKSQYDVFSGGVNYGVDFGVKSGTPVGLPPGEWEVLEAFNQAGGQGRIGDKTNRGYGNSVLVMNKQTGETLRLSHLNRVAVKPGQVVPGGSVIATSGATGNVTGPHLDVEYRNQRGKLNDVLRTPYARFLVGQGGTSSGKGGGFMDFLKEGIKRVKNSNPDQYNIYSQMAQGNIGPEALKPATQFVGEYVNNRYVKPILNTPGAVGQLLNPNSTLAERGMGALQTLGGVATVIPDPIQDIAMPIADFIKGASKAENRGQGVALNLQSGLNSMSLKNYAGLGDVATTNPAGQALGNLAEIPLALAIGSIARKPLVKKVDRKLFKIGSDFDKAMEDINVGKGSMTNLPILVAKNSDGTYGILDGNHRLAQLLRSGEEKIDVMTDEGAYRKLSELQENFNPYGNKPPETNIRYLRDELGRYAGSKKVDPLLEEAKKYKSAEEFGTNVVNISNNVKANELRQPSLFTIYDNGNAVGRLHLSKDSIGGKKLAHIDGIEIDKKYRGKGLGTKLLNNAIDALKLSEYDGIVARYETIKNKKEIPYIFNKLGFSDIGDGTATGKLFTNKQQLTDIWNKAQGTINKAKSRLK